MGFEPLLPAAGGRLTLTRPTLDGLKAELGWDAGSALPVKAPERS
ncbi:MAG: hypothetical protein V4701_09230 [Pseudomonadota bacterium]